MPELPEVETLRRGLEKSLVGRQIIDAVVANAKVLKNQPEAVFTQRIIGCSIASVRRRGKYLLFDLYDGSSAVAETSNSPLTFPFVLCIHLKMRGQLRVDRVRTEGNDAEVPEKYLCVTLYLDGGAKTGDKEIVLRFLDAWTWGEMRVLTPGELEADVPALSAMGCEPLHGGPWTVDDLRAKLKKRSGPIKPLLLDQSVVAGVGNIYADESLFRAGIQPTRAGKSLTESEIARLVKTVQTVLGEAVESGGTTSEEFGDVSGQAGKFTPRVYDRGGKPCLLCGQVLTRIRLGGRGTVFCPVCQK